MRDVGCDFEHQHSARATAGGGGERDGTWAAVVFTTCSAEWALNEFYTWLWLYSSGEATVGSDKHTKYLQMCSLPFY